MGLPKLTGESSLRHSLKELLKESSSLRMQSVITLPTDVTSCLV